MRSFMRRARNSILSPVFGGRRDALTILANRYGSDKGNKAHGRHCYAEIYDRLFCSKRLEPIPFLEIGLLHPFDTDGVATRAPSLHINDFSMVALPNCTIFRGDMGSRADLRRMARSVATPFDIIVEDGSHASHHQQIALATLFPFVAAGGLYIIEDLHWQPAAIEKIAIPKTRSLCRDFKPSGTIRSPVITDDESTYLAENIESIDLFDSMDRYNVDNKDGLAVITKRLDVAGHGCRTAISQL